MVGARHTIREVDMHDDSQIRKSADQVRAEFDAASDPDAWFIGELADFFAPDADDDDQRMERVGDVIDRLGAERELFLESVACRDDLVSVDIEFSEPGLEPYRTGTFTRMPSPAVLLEMCTVVCDPTDEVVVRHRYANGLVANLTAVWPFGMDDAVDPTAPIGQALEAADEMVTARSRLHRARLERYGPLVASGVALSTSLLAAALASRRRRQ
jgi:hypothetical protein